MEAKIALIELLKRFTFVRAPETEVCNNIIMIIITSPVAIHFFAVIR